MWKNKYSNFICGYLEAYENQKKHIERVLSAKEIIKSLETPYFPKFLKIKSSKHQMEEEKNEQIKSDNQKLFIKIINAEEKPSKYSKIFEPEKCPAFDKDFIYFKRIKKEINNYQENVRFYNKIEKVKSHYESKELIERKKQLEANKKRLQKSIFEIHPSLLFLSPARIKNEIQKFRNAGTATTRTMKRSNSSLYNKININNRPSSAQLLSAGNKKGNRSSSVCANERAIKNFLTSNENHTENKNKLDNNEKEPKKLANDNKDDNKTKEKEESKDSNKKESIEARESNKTSIKSENKSSTKSKKSNQSNEKNSSKIKKGSKKNSINSSDLKKTNNQSNNIPHKKSKLKRNTSEINIFHS